MPCNKAAVVHSFQPPFLPTKKPPRRSFATLKATTSATTYTNNHTQIPLLQTIKPDHFWRPTISRNHCFLLILIHHYL